MSLGLFVPLQQPHQVTLQLLLSIQLKSLVPSEQITSVLQLLDATGPCLLACLLPSAVLDTDGVDNTGKTHCGTDKRESDMIPFCDFQKD